MGRLPPDCAGRILCLRASDAVSDSKARSPGSIAQGRVAELFAGVGGFRLGLEGPARSARRGSAWRVVWSNQWEPSTRAQHASDCYTAHYGIEGHVREDIHTVLERAERRRRILPKIDLLVGGFPCQDYSVARVLSQAAGLEGKKGVLWWEIEKFLKLRQPRFIFLENVDRLLKSPASQRGRDFAMMLRCLADLGYYVEWRVVNAADYGFPQRRRRVLIVGERVRRRPFTDAVRYLERDGVLAEALPCRVAGPIPLHPIELPEDRLLLSEKFAASFEHAGAMYRGKVWTMRVDARYGGKRKVLSDVLLDEGDVPAEYFIPDRQLPAWRHLKGAKREARTTSKGFEYFYAEGAIPFPDPIDRPSRTILTGEGGATPSRFKHVVQTPSGRLRRLTAVELERLNGFPQGWTDTGMPDGRRAFCMGNALVVGLVARVGARLARRLEARPAPLERELNLRPRTPGRQRSAAEP